MKKLLHNFFNLFWGDYSFCQFLMLPKYKQSEWKTEDEYVII